MLRAVELGLFDAAAEVVRTLADDEGLRIRARRWGLKVWFGPATPTPVHWEAQLLAARHVQGATALALEVGLHLEDRDAARNDALLAALVTAEPRWRRSLGEAPVAGPFLGRPEDWRRVSETWVDPDLDDPALATDVGTRTIEYVRALGPFVVPVA